MTREQLLILVVVAFVLLINFAARVLRRRRESAMLRESEPEAPQSPPRAHRLPPPVVQPRRTGEGAHGVPLPLAVPRSAARPRVRSPLGSLRQVRRGIVLMTVLGPCRALEPPGPQT
jgi:hypothetical protein